MRVLSRDPVVVILLAFALALTPAVVYHFSAKSERETLVFFGSVVGGLLGLYTLLLAVEQYEAGVEQHRRELAHHLIERWNDTTMESQKDVLRAAFAGTLEPADFARNSRPDFADDEQGRGQKKAWEATRNQIVAILSFCEEVALAVNTGSAKEGLIRRWMEMILQQTFAKFSGWIEGETIFVMKGNPEKVDGEIQLEVFEELEKTVRRWKTGEDPSLKGAKRADLVNAILNQKTA